MQHQKTFIQITTALFVSLFMVACSVEVGDDKAGPQVAGDAPVTYQVSFENAAQNEARISVTFREAGDKPLEVRMSRSSPGRYALHEFAKNVYSVGAVDGAGNPLTLTRPDPYSWLVPGHDGTVTVSYTLFADRADGTYSQIDRTHAHLNMPATFMWARGLESREIEVTFQPASPDWKAATQLQRTNEPMTFGAPNLYYFLDSPVELSNHMVRSWTVGEGDAAQTINLAVHHAGSEADMDRYAAMAQVVVDEQIDIFGEAPRFDYGEYVFIACYLPHVSGDGMEHRNSTILTSSGSLEQSNFGQLGTLSHEFIHIWNVERIRPKTLEPFDFTRANMTNELWFAEGFTSYYGPLAIRRAGESTVERYVQGLSGLVNAVTNMPGRGFVTPESASRMAPFVDAGTSIDPTNMGNVFFSYYSYGNAVALALDLSIRGGFPGKDLDGFMQAMWQRHGVPEIPYTLADIEATLAGYTGDSAFAKTFLDRYVRDSQLPDYASLMARAGLEVSMPDVDKPWAVSRNLLGEDDGVVSLRFSMKGIPLYDAGVNKGDRITSMAGREIRSIDDFMAVVDDHKPGDTLSISYVSRGMDFTTDMVLAGNPQVTVTLMDDDIMSEEQKAFRKAWIGE